MRTVICLSIYLMLLPPIVYINVSVKVEGRLLSYITPPSTPRWYTFKTVQ